MGEYVKLLIYKCNTGCNIQCALSWNHSLSRSSPSSPRPLVEAFASGFLLDVATSAFCFQPRSGRPPPRSLLGYPLSLESTSVQVSIFGLYYRQVKPEDDTDRKAQNATISFHKNPTAFLRVLIHDIYFSLWGLSLSGQKGRGL